MLSVVGPPVGQAVDQPGIAVLGENHRFVLGEQRVEILVGEAVRMLLVRLQRHEIDDVHHPDFQVREMVPEQERWRPASLALARRPRRP